MPDPKLSITYFSDVLCVWAWIAQLRVDEAQNNFGTSIQFEDRFCNVFGDTERKIPAAWGAADGYERFNAHLAHAAAGFPEVQLNPDVWIKCRPRSSLGAHVYLKAATLVERDGGQPGSAAKALRAMRHAFFAYAEDISALAVQRRICAASGVDTEMAESFIASGAAQAAIVSDYADADAMKIQGSPTFVLNGGRQKLYGNVGYRILEANIQELLREPTGGQASWC